MSRKDFNNHPNLPLFQAEYKKIWKYVEDNHFSNMGPSPSASSVIRRILQNESGAEEGLRQLILDSKLEIPENLATDFELYCQQELESVWGMMMM